MVNIAHSDTRYAAVGGVVTGDYDIVIYVDERQEMDEIEKETFYLYHNYTRKVINLIMKKFKGSGLSIDMSSRKVCISQLSSEFGHSMTSIIESLGGMPSELAFLQQVDETEMPVYLRRFFRENEVDNLE